MREVAGDSYSEDIPVTSVPLDESESAEKFEISGENGTQRYRCDANIWDGCREYWIGYGGNNNNNIYLVWPQRGTWLHRRTARRAGGGVVHAKVPIQSDGCHAVPLNAAELSGGENLRGGKRLRLRFWKDTEAQRGEQKEMIRRCKPSPVSGMLRRALEQPPQPEIIFVPDKSSSSSAIPYPRVSSVESDREIQLPDPEESNLVITGNGFVAQDECEFVTWRSYTTWEEAVSRVGDTGRSVHV
jgi:hypothetical protein